MFKLLDILLRRIVHRGSLTLIDADGTSHRFGDGRPPGVVIRLADKRLARQLVTDPELALAEAYMRGRLQMVEGRIYDFLELVLSNLQAKPLPTWTQGFRAGRFMARRMMQFNPAGRSRRNVAHHYDIDGAIYDLF